MSTTISQLLSGEGENHILPFFWQHGEDEDTLRHYMGVIQEANCNAVCVESRPHPDFCGPKWWADMDVILDEARKRGMKVWILDDSHFPTGFCNGAVMNAPDRLRRQSVYTKVISPKKPGAYTISLDKLVKGLPSTLLGGLMAKADKDGKHHFTDDRLLSVSMRGKGSAVPVELPFRNDSGRLTVQIPPDAEKVYFCFVTRNAGYHRSYMNMLNEESCRILIDTVYEPHWEHYKEDFGKTIAGFFSDEPELGNGVYFNNDVSVGRDFDLPFSDRMETALADRLGEDWVLQIPLIWDTDPDVADAASKVRVLFMDAVSRLVEECFSRQVGGWCAEHGVEYIGHIIEDGNAHARTANSLGHYFRALSGQHMAGIDDIGGQVLPFKEDAPPEGYHKFLDGRDGEFYHFCLGKLGQSMAAIQPEKQGRAMCEIFGNYGWSEGPRAEKYLADHFMVQGINYYVPHAFSPKKYPDSDCPPHFYAHGHNPGYRAFGALMAYMNRVCALISGGKSITDTAVLYHAEADWAGDFMKDQKVLRTLMEHQIDCHLLPQDVFTEKERYQTTISAEGLTINGNTYHTLFIPYAQYITPALAEAIGELAESGCRVMFAGVRPQALTGGEPLPEAAAGVPVVPMDQLENHALREILAAPDAPRLRAFHYKNDAQEIYYFVNEDERTWEGEIRIPAVSAAVVYNAWENRMERQTLRQEEDATVLTMRLCPSESRIVVVNDASLAALFRAEHPAMSPAVDGAASGSDSVSDASAEGKEAAVAEALPLPLTELANGYRRALSFAGAWTRSTCASVDYPAFKGAVSVSAFGDYGKEKRKFSGFLAYENRVNLPAAEPLYNADGSPKRMRTILEITDAGEDVEVFVNGQSAGIQVLPPFLYDVTELVTEGENTVRIEVATTLERERGTGLKAAPIGITGEVNLFQTGE